MNPPPEPVMLCLNLVQWTSPQLSSLLPGWRNPPRNLIHSNVHMDFCKTDESFMENR
jgi:hypothetical protein